MAALRPEAVGPVSVVAKRLLTRRTCPSLTVSDVMVDVRGLGIPF